MKIRYFAIQDMDLAEIKDGFVGTDREELEKRMIDYLIDITIDSEDSLILSDWKGSTNQEILAWYGYEVKHIDRATYEIYI